MNQQTDRLFTRYNGLPGEIRRQILGYTDLARDYHIQNGKVHFSPQCCRHCSKTLFPCCCNTIPQAQLRIVAGSRVSSRCACKFDPIPFLKVSKRFRAEALEMLFARPNQFLLTGQIEYHLAFLGDIKSYLSYLQNISLRISEEDMQKWEKGEDVYWTEFVEYFVSHCKLSLVSMHIIGSYFWNDDYDDEPPDEDGWRHYRAYYQSFVPGFRRLIDQGLMELEFQFLHHLKPMLKNTVDL